MLVLLLLFYAILDGEDDELAGGLLDLGEVERVDLALEAEDVLQRERPALVGGARHDVPEDQLVGLLRVVPEERPHPLPAERLLVDPRQVLEPLRLRDLPRDNLAGVPRGHSGHCRRRRVHLLRRRGCLRLVLLVLDLCLCLRLILLILRLDLCLLMILLVLRLDLNLCLRLYLSLLLVLDLNLGLRLRLDLCLNLRDLGNLRNLRDLRNLWNLGYLGILGVLGWGRWDVKGGFLGQQGDP